MSRSGSVWTSPGQVGGADSHLRGATCLWSLPVTPSPAQGGRVPGKPLLASTFRGSVSPTNTHGPWTLRWAWTLPPSSGTPAPQHPGAVGSEAQPRGAPGVGGPGTWRQRSWKCSWEGQLPWRPHTPLQKHSWPRTELCHVTAHQFLSEVTWCQLQNTGSVPEMWPGVGRPPGEFQQKGACRPACLPQKP